MNMARQRDSEFRPEIRRGRLDRLTIYEISEGELELLAQGAPNSVLLNFSIALLTTAGSFLIALATTTIESPWTFTVFVLVALVCGINGVGFLVLWYRGSRSVSALVETIRNRVPPEEGIQEIPPSAGP